MSGAKQKNVSGWRAFGEAERAVSFSLYFSGLMISFQTVYSISSKCKNVLGKCKIKILKSLNIFFNKAQ